MSRARERRSTFVALVVAFLFASLATPQDNRFGETTDVVLVQIPVHVTRNGEPIRNLTAENFEVLEGKKRQKIVAVDVFDLELAAASVGVVNNLLDPPPAGRRSFLLLFDLSNSAPAGTVRAREAALDLARRGLHPSDLVAVATYSKVSGAQILMGFSTDRSQLVAAIEGLGLVQPFEQLNDPLRLSLAEVDYIEGGGGKGWIFDKMEGDPGGGGGGVKNNALIEYLKDLSTFSRANNKDQAKAQILDLSANLERLAQLLDSVSGRKQVLLFSQGFDSEVVFGTTDQKRIAEMEEEKNFGNFWRVDAEEMYGASDAQASLTQMLDQFNRSDCAVHTVDTGGLAARGEAGAFRTGNTEFGATQLNRGHDGLALMANETGGEFYRNFNNLTDAMDDLLERTSVTYVISIQPKSVEMDGAFHPIKVRLKDVPKGGQISHRPGYYARRPYSDLDPMERQIITAEQLMAGSPGGEISTHLLAAAFPGSGDKANVLTAIEIEGTSLTSGAADNIVPTEIYTYAFDEHGQIRDFFGQTVMIDLYKVGYRLGTGFKLLSHLELPPGRYEIRSLVRDAHHGTTGLSVSSLTVPDFVDGEVALLPPFFIEPDDMWLIGLADRTVEEDQPYPLMGNGKRMVPASRPHLVSDQPIPVLLVGYRLPEDLETEGHLIGDDGKIYEDVAISVDRRVADRGDGERLMAQLLATDIKPGNYRLVVTLRGDGEEVSSSVPVLFLNYD